MKHNSSPLFTFYIFRTYFSFPFLLRFINHNLLNTFFLGLLGIRQLCLTFKEPSSESPFVARFILELLRLRFHDWTHRSSGCGVLVEVVSETVGLGAVPLVANSALMLFGITGRWPPATAARVCSQKRTCTTTRNGSNSFCAACMHASRDSFLQSSVRQSCFLSLLFRSGWAWLTKKSKNLNSKSHNRMNKIISLVAFYIHLFING